MMLSIVDRGELACRGLFNMSDECNEQPAVLMMTKKPSCATGPRPAYTTWMPAVGNGTVCQSKVETHPLEGLLPASVENQKRNSCGFFSKQPVMHMRTITTKQGFSEW